MNDCISRQMAIDLLDNLIGMVDDNHGSDYDAALRMGIEALKAEEPVRCEDCRWGREVCGNIECFVDSDIFTEYHAYEWFCPNGERKHDATS